MAKRARITAKAPKPPTQTLEQRLLIQQLTENGYAALPEVRFHPARKWRIDVAVSSRRVLVNASTGEWHTNPTCIAIEIDGGAWIAGRHTRGAGVEADNEKIAALAAQGWRFIRVTPKQVRDGTALKWVEAALARDAA